MYPIRGITKCDSNHYIELCEDLADSHRFSIVKYLNTNFVSTINCLTTD